MIPYSMPIDTPPSGWKKCQARRTPSPRHNMMPGACALSRFYEAA